jgi:cell wall-associated NlpC family hydrolase
VRRPAFALALLAAFVAAAPAQPAKPPRSWAHAEISLLVERGLMSPDVKSFRPDDQLTQGELGDLVSAVTGRPAAGLARPDAPVTLAGLDAQLVRALGLHDSATALTQAARAAGLRPPSRFGTEVLARSLGLRTNHPAARDELELLPSEPVTRAEAAYSAARILRFTGTEVERVRELAVSFALPALDTWQQRILTTGIAFIGFPYVWGGESEHPDGSLGPQAKGGFDCSGLVWRIFKLQPYPEAAGLAATLRGRTTFELSRETPRGARIPFARLVPGDVVFFGANGPRSTPSQVDHMSVYAGNGWMLHSSGHGVTVVPLAGWYRQHFAWARRPLAEAGFASTEQTP